MPFLITCDACGAENQLGRMHCAQCGAKLEIKDPRTQAKPKNAGSSLGRFIRILLVLLLLLALVLILRPVVPGGIEGGLQDAQRMQQKLRTLKSAVMDRKAVTQRISEAEINGYFADLIKRNPQEGTMTLQRVNVALQTGVAVIVVESSIGPARLTYRIEGVPGTQGDEFTFDIRSVQVGHLPMPGPLGEWMAGTISVVFSQMTDERRTLGELSRLDVGQGEVVAGTAGVP